MLFQKKIVFFFSLLLNFANVSRSDAVSKNNLVPRYFQQDNCGITNEVVNSNTLSQSTWITLYRPSCLLFHSIYSIEGYPADEHQVPLWIRGDPNLVRPLLTLNSTTDRLFNVGYFYNDEECQSSSMQEHCGKRGRLRLRNLRLKGGGIETELGGAIKVFKGELVVEQVTFHSSSFTVEGEKGNVIALHQGIVVLIDVIFEYSKGVSMIYVGPCRPGVSCSNIDYSNHPKITRLVLLNTPTKARMVLDDRRTEEDKLLLFPQSCDVVVFQEQEQEKKVADYCKDSTTQDEFNKLSCWQDKDLKCTYGETNEMRACPLGKPAGNDALTLEEVRNKTLISDCFLTSDINIPSENSIIISGLSMLGSTTSTHGFVTIDRMFGGKHFIVKRGATLTLQRLVLIRGYDPNMPTESTDTHEQGQGGSVYVHELSSLYLNKVIFRDNNATNGGAIYSKKPKKVIITESTLTHNFALGSGGSIYIETDNVDLSTVQTSVQIQNSIISHNYARGLTTGSAGAGGGIYIKSSSAPYDGEMVITIKQSTFTSNGVSSSGGAIKVVTNNNPKNIFVVIFECDMYNNFIYTKRGEFLVNDVAADDMKSQIFLLNTDVNSIGGVTCGNGTCGNKKCSQSVQLECKKLGYDGCTTIGEHDTIRSTPFCHPIRICTPSKANRTANKYYWYGEMNVNQTNGCTMLRTVYLNSDFTINGDKQFLPLLRAPIIQLGNFSTYDNRSTDIKILEPTNEELEDLSEYSRRYFSVSQHSKVTINYVTLSGGRTCIKRRSGLDSLKSTCGGGSLRIINYGDRPSHVILNGVHMKGCLGHQKFACSEFGGGIFISGKGSVLEINANSSFENNRARVHGGAIYAQNIAYCEFGNNDCTPKFTITGGVSFKDNIAIGDPYIISPIISPGESKEAKEKVFKVFKEYGIGRGGAIALSNNIEDLITKPDQTEAEEAASGTIVIESGPSNSIVFSNNVAIGNSMYGMSGMDITTFEVPVSHSIYAKLASIQFTTCPRGTYAFNPDTNPKIISSPQKLGYNFVGCPNVCSKMWTTSGNTKTDYLEASSSSPCSKTCPAGYFCPGDFSASSSPGIALCPPSRFGDISGLDKPTCSGECDPPASCGEPGGALKRDGTKYCNVVGKWEVIIADSCMLSTTYIVQGKERKRIQGDSLHIRTLWGPPSPRTLTNEEPKRHFKVEQGGTLQVSRLKLKGGVIYNVQHKRENYHSGSILYNEGTVELFNVEFIKNDVKKDEPNAYTGGCVYSGTKSILTVEESTFSNCYAGLFGGAIHFNGDILNVTSSDFENNFANISGGAIYLEQKSTNKIFAVNFKTDTTSGRTNKFTDNGAENQDQANAIGWSRLPGSTINFDLCPASTFGLSGDSFAPYDDGVINTQCKVQSLDSRISYEIIKCFPKAKKSDVGFAKNFYGCPNLCPVRKTTVPLFLSAKRQASPNKRHQFCNKTCPVNYFCDGENHGPIACPTGKYGDKLGLQTQDECKECEAGMFFDSKKCTICPGGYFQNSDGKNQCIECSVGYYRPNFSRKQDAKFCLECDDQNEPGKTVCPGCEFGFGLELNAMYNKNDNKYNKTLFDERKCSITNNTNKVCCSCNAGYFNSGGNNQCRECQPGYYSKPTPLKNRSIEFVYGSCEVCSPGKFSTITKGKSKDVCKSCGEGKYGSLSPENRNQESSGCKNCPKGFYGAVENITRCSSCFFGQYQDEVKSIECKKCTKGRYGDEAASYTPCKNCPVGRSQNIKGQAMCIACPSGKFSNETGEEKCKNCPEGYYRAHDTDNNNNKVMTSNCSSCPEGWYQNIGGQSACILCGTGQYQNRYETGGKTCRNCPKGMYQDQMGKENCTSCPTGMYQDDEGGNRCNKCAVGRFASKEHSTTCEKCEYGKYSREESSEKCKTCDKFKVPNQQSSECVTPTWKTPSSCSKDEYLDDSSSDPFKHKCIKCPFGGSCIGSSTLDGTYGIVKNCSGDNYENRVGCIYVKHSSNVSSSELESIVPLFGFYKCRDNSEKYGDNEKSEHKLFDECIFHPACLGASNPSLEEQFALRENQTNLKEGRCNIAYVEDSLLCSACKNGFSHSDIPGKCDKCPSMEENTNLAILGIFIGIIGTVIYVVITLKMGFDETDGMKSIGFSFLQLLSLLTTFPIAWPKIFTAIFNVGGTITVLGQHLVDLKCLWAENGSNEITDAYVFYTFKVLWAISAPILISGCLLCWGLLRILPCIKFASSCNAEYRGNIRASVVALLYLIYPALCAETFSMFACRSVCSKSNSGKLYLFADLRETCFTGRHLDYIIGLGIPMLLLYVIGLPLAAVIGVKRLKARALLKEKPSFTLKGHKTWQLFYAIYRKDTWWWEATVAGRKVTIAAIGVFGAVLGDMQTHVTSAVIVFIIMATSYVRPYATKQDDTVVIARGGILQGVEMSCLLALWLTLWAGSIFNNYPRCMDPTKRNGETLGWCDGLSIIVALIDIFVIIMIIFAFCYLVWIKNKMEKQGKENARERAMKRVTVEENAEKRRQSVTLQMSALAHSRGGGENKVYENLFTTKKGISENELYENPLNSKNTALAMNDKKKGRKKRKSIVKSVMNSKNNSNKNHASAELSVNVKPITIQTTPRIEQTSNEWDRYFDQTSGKWYKVNRATGVSKWV